MKMKSVSQSKFHNAAKLRQLFVGFLNFVLKWGLEELTIFGQLCLVLLNEVYG